MAKFRQKKRKNLPKKKAQAAKEPSIESDSSRGSSCYSSDDYSSSNSGDDYSSRSCSESPKSSSCEDPREYKRGGYHPVERFQLYANQYRVLGKLGAGAFSTVWLCLDERSEPRELVAMKVCKSSKSVCEQTLDEMKLLSELDHPCVMQMKNHFWHTGPYGQHKCLIFDLMGENLLALVRYYEDEGLPVKMVKKIAADTLRGVAHIHSRNIIHTDIKLENVLLSRHDLELLYEEADEAKEIYDNRARIIASRKVPVDTTNMTKSQKKRLRQKQKKAAEKDAENAPAEEEGDDELPPLPPPLSRQKNRFDTFKFKDIHCKLTDFGNGCWTDKHFTEEIQTRQYRSPEVLLGQEYDTATDIWSCACMFFELLTGEFLFSPKSSKKWSRDEDHITLMIELLGEYPPREWAMKGNFAKVILNNDGHPKKIKNLKFWGLVDVMIEKYGLSEEESRDFADFLLPMLHWIPEDRVTAEEALKHPWLQIDENDSDDDRIDLNRGIYVRKETTSYEPSSEEEGSTSEVNSPGTTERTTEAKEIKSEEGQGGQNFGTSASSSETRESQSEADLDEPHKARKGSINSISLSTVTEKQPKQPLLEQELGSENIPPHCLPTLDREED